MKNSITLIVSIFWLSIAIAQDAQLFENDWYIEKVEKAGEEIVPPDSNCSKYGRVYFENEDFSTEDACCETGCTSNIIYQGNNMFELSGKIPCLLDTGCSDEQWNFFAQHNGIYFGEPTIGFYNPYEYQITNDGDSLALVVTNGIGDKAYYNNVLLSTQIFQDLKISIYPNPVKDRLVIESQVPIEHLQVYSINGREVLRESVDIESVNVSKLPSGIYFMSIDTQEGTLIKKFIKN